MASRAVRVYEAAGRPSPGRVRDFLRQRSVDTRLCHSHSPEGLHMLNPHRLSQPPRPRALPLWRARPPKSSSAPGPAPLERRDAVGPPTTCTNPLLTGLALTPVLQGRVTWGLGVHELCVVVPGRLTFPGNAQGSPRPDVGGLARPRRHVENTRPEVRISAFGWGWDWDWGQVAHELLPSSWAGTREVRSSLRSGMWL